MRPAPGKLTQGRRGSFLLQEKHSWHIISYEMSQPAPAQAAPSPQKNVVVTKALRRAATSLGLSQKELARVVGVSEATVSRLGEGRTLLDAEKKEGELALLFLRVFRSLDALVGGSEQKATAWFSAPNAHVGGVPKERVQSVEGLVQVAQYLDAMRGKL
jgi:DNA-binding XRE family transcriptional regulator